MNRLYRTCLLALSALFLAQGPVVAQQVSDLTVELIDQRINTLRDAGAADDSEPLSIYDSTRTLLTQEESFLRDAATFEESLTAEPEREAAIQQRLDALDAEYDPLVEIQVMSAEQMSARLSQARIDQRTTKVDVVSRKPPQGFQCAPCHEHAVGAADGHRSWSQSGWVLDWQPQAPRAGLPASGERVPGQPGASVLEPSAGTH